MSAGCTTTGSSDAEPDEQEPAMTASLDEFYLQELDWAGCGNGFECAHASVPMDYEDPDGPTVRLPLIRLPAADQQQRVGSLLINPGGPGASGINYARFGTPVSDDVRQVFDVVGFDPRGIATSRPRIDCYSDEDLDAFLDGELTPDTAAEVDESIAEQEAFVAACSAETGMLLEHVGTDDVARDLDVLRAALGDEVLYYLGKSYGTSIGAEYIRQFPERVGRVVLDGVVDPSLDASGLALGQAGGIERALQAFAEDCAARSCSLGNTPRAVVRNVERVLEAAADDPLPTDQVGRPLTEANAFEGVIFPLYLDKDQGYPALERGLADALRGNGAFLMLLSDAYRMRSPTGDYEGNANEAIGAVNCADRGGEGSVEDVQDALPEYEQVSPTFGEYLVWTEYGCGAWPDSEQISPGPVTGSGAAPILVVGTTGDLATPYEWAESVADQLESGVLLTYDSTPHTAYRLGSACIDAAVDTYLIEGTPPEDGTVCD
jgi:pimeloyl-ACP methyl ester carboxylesterase